MEILKRLFVNWELDTWANVLEVIGFLFAVAAFLVGMFIKSEINKLKTSYVFNKRINNHISNLKKSASELNLLLNDYNNNTNGIRTEFSNCIAELEDLTPKIGFRQSFKCRSLTSFLKARRKRDFVSKQATSSPLKNYLTKYPKRIYQTTYDDVWIVYDRLIEIIRQMENIKQNRDKSL